MSAVLSEAETKFFSSRGEEVDSSLAPEPAKEPEKAAEPAAKPQEKPAEPAKASEPAKAPDAPPAQHVPIAALHEERQKRARAEQERAQLQAALQQFQQAQEQASKPQPPDPEADPLGHQAFQIRQQQEELQELRTWRQQQEQTQHQQRAFSQFTQRVVAAEQAYRAEHTDYDAAAAFAISQYDKLLTASIPDPAQRQQQIQVMAGQELARVVGQGGNPAEFVYNFARSMGYAGPAPAVAVTPQPTPAPAAPAPQTLPAAVETIQRGLKQQSSIASGGATPASEVTPEMALALKGDEFNKWWSKQFKK